MYLIHLLFGKTVFDTPNPTKKIKPKNSPLKVCEKFVNENGNNQRKIKIKKLLKIKENKEYFGYSHWLFLAKNNLKLIEVKISQN